MERIVACMVLPEDLGHVANCFAFVVDRVVLLCSFLK